MPDCANLRCGMEPQKQSVKLFVQKNVPYVTRMNAALAELTPLSKEQGSSFETMLRVCCSDQDPEIQPIELAVGDWLVQARFPSGETISKQILVGSEPVFPLEAT